MTPHDDQPTDQPTPPKNHYPGIPAADQERVDAALNNFHAQLEQRLDAALGHFDRTHLLPGQPLPHPTDQPDPDDQPTQYLDGFAPWWHRMIARHEQHQQDVRDRWQHMLDNPTPGDTIRIRKPDHTTYPLDTQHLDSHQHDPYRLLDQVTNLLRDRPLPLPTDPPADDEPLYLVSPRTAHQLRQTIYQDAHDAIHGPRRPWYYDTLLGVSTQIERLLRTSMAIPDGIAIRLPTEEERRQLHTYLHTHDTPQDTNEHPNDTTGHQPTNTPDTTP